MNKNEPGDWLHPKADEEEPPPFLRTWSRLYVVVIVYTCSLVLALLLMTATLNR